MAALFVHIQRQHLCGGWWYLPWPSACSYSFCHLFSAAVERELESMWSKLTLIMFTGNCHKWMLWGSHTALACILLLSEMSWVGIQLFTLKDWEFIRTGCPSISTAQKWLISTPMAATNLYTRTAPPFLFIITRYWINFFSECWLNPL